MVDTFSKGRCFLAGGKHATGPIETSFDFLSADTAHVHPPLYDMLKLSRDLF